MRPPISVFELYIPSMVCPACIAPVNVLAGCAKVKKVTANYVEHIVTVESEGLTDGDSDYITQLKDAVTDVGYPCEGFLEITPEEQNEETDAQRVAFEVQKNTHTKKMIRQYWLKGIVGLLSGVAILLLAILSVNIPMLGMYIMAGISTLFTLYFGKETYQKAAIELVKNKTLSMDALFSMSTLLALGISAAAFFVHGLSMMFDVALLILGFKNIGRAIEESAKQRLVQQSFRANAPREIAVESSAGIKAIPVKNLWPGNIIIVYKGQTVPVDGICLSENTTIYNTIVTGRTLPQPITTNHIIYAGCVVPEDVEFIKIQVTYKEASSYLALLDQRIKTAELEKSTIETAAAKSLKYFIPIIFAIAALSAIVVGIFISPLAAVYSAISVLVSACPCALGLVTPLAIKTGIAKAAEHGVSFKSGKSIEVAADIDTVVFDLNGTLTTGMPKVIKSTIPPEMLGFLAGMEAESAHPIAQAICKFAKEQKQEHPEYKSFHLDKSHHAGMAAKINDEYFVIGNSQMMVAQQINISKFDKDIAQENAEHVIYFAKNKQVIGYLLLEDPLCDDAVATINELKKQGKKIYICTGADDQTTKRYADKLGIVAQNIRANCLGESKDVAANTKTAHIRQLINQGRRVAMVGDAGNDAPAVAASHFGIAVTSLSGNKVTQDKAEAIINQNSLWSVVNAFTVAKQTVANIKQNLVVSIGYNLLSIIAFSGLLLALGFAVNPALGALLMVVQTVFILMNVERFRRQTVPTIPGEDGGSSSGCLSCWRSTDRKLHQHFPPKSKLEKEATLSARQNDGLQRLPGADVPPANNPKPNHAICVDGSMPAFTK